jgi:hypothetical protein
MTKFGTYKSFGELVVLYLLLRNNASKPCERV